MPTPTKDQLLILNSILYSPDFKDFYNMNKDVNVYKWAMQFDVNCIDENNRPGEISRNEFQNIVNTIKNNPDIYKNMIIENVEQENANIHSDKKAYITNATITYGDSTIIAYKGTGGDIEWIDNGEGAYSDTTDTVQQQKALDYYERMKQLYGADQKIYVTGHSKGGNKAQYVGVLKGDEIEHVYSFDGQGFGSAFLLKYKDLIEQNKNKITNISNEYDFVNILLFPIAGERIYIKSNSTFGITNEDIGIIFNSLLFNILPKPLSPISSVLSFLHDTSPVLFKSIKHKLFGFHSAYSMFELKDDNLTLGEDVGQSPITKFLHELILYYSKYMDEDDFRFIIYSTMSLLVSGNPEDYGEKYTMPEGFIFRFLELTKGFLESHKGFDFIELIDFMDINPGIFLASFAAYSSVDAENYALVTRDFSDSVKQQLLSLVDEVEDESFLNITKWDVFYRVEKFFGGLDFPANADELDSYYKKLIDIEGMGKEQINKIFSEVENEDNNFSNDLKKINATIEKVNASLNQIDSSFNL